jgi:hypothetical protein
MDRRTLLNAAGLAGAGLVLGGRRLSGARDDEPGKPASPGPLGHGHAHFCGIHLAKANAKLQIVTQHYCAAHTSEGEDDAMFQCVLFDSASQNARLLGVEYIITDARYRRLSVAEKKYWHPHTYEVLAGGLIAPGMEPEKEREFMRTILTTWGKAWHTWPDPQSSVPVGEPLLIWSLTGDGQADEAVIAKRDREFGVSTGKVRARRLEEFGLEAPRVSQPRSLETIGRQWNDSGADEPTRRGG